MELGKLPNLGKRAAVYAFIILKHTGYLTVSFLFFHFNYLRILLCSKCVSLRRPVSHGVYAIDL